MDPVGRHLPAVHRGLGAVRRLCRRNRTNRHRTDGQKFGSDGISVDPPLFPPVPFRRSGRRHGADTRPGDDAQARFHAASVRRDDHRICRRRGARDPADRADQCIETVVQSLFLLRHADQDALCGTARNILPERRRRGLERKNRPQPARRGRRTRRRPGAALHAALPARRRQRSPVGRVPQRDPRTLERADPEPVRQRR